MAVQKTKRSKNINKNRRFKQFINNYKKIKYYFCSTCETKSILFNVCFICHKDKYKTKQDTGFLKFNKILKSYQI